MCSPAAVRRELLITLSSAASDYIGLLLLAAVCGFIGGLAAELLLTHGKRTGLVAKPHSVGRTAWYDLGLFGPMILGAIAAVAVLYFFPPVVQVKSGNTVTSSYDLVKVVALSLIIGSAGARFLSAMQDKVLNQLNQQKVQDTVTTANKQIQAVAKQSAAKAGAATQIALASLEPQIVQLVKDAAAGAPTALTQALSEVGGSAKPVTLEARLNPVNELLNLSVEGGSTVDVPLSPEATAAAASAKVHDLIAQAVQQATQQASQSMEPEVEHALATVSAIGQPVRGE